MLQDCCFSSIDTKRFIDPDEVSVFRVAIAILNSRDIASRNIMLRKSGGVLGVCCIDNEDQVGRAMNHYREYELERMGLPSSKYLPKTFLDMAKRWEPYKMFGRLSEVTNIALCFNASNEKTKLYLENYLGAIPLIKRSLIIVKTLAEELEEVKTDLVPEMLERLRCFICEYDKGVILSVNKPAGIDFETFEREKVTVPYDRIDRSEIDGIADFVRMLIKEKGETE